MEERNYSSSKLLSTYMKYQIKYPSKIPRGLPLLLGLLYLVLDGFRDAEVDEVSASDMIPGSVSKSVTLRPTARVLLLPEEEDEV